MSRKFVAVAVFFVFVMTAALLAAPVYKESDSSKDLIRFHVIANSDSLQDQQLKHKVRDAILDQVASRFKNTLTVEDARKICLANMDEIESVAKQEIVNNGHNYPVEAELGCFDFPAKTYGGFALPEGNYEAVRVVIGDGKGANWWCVLFPPLCFVDISNSVSVEPGVTKVSKDIHDTEAKNVEEDDHEAAEPVIQLRFKLFEVFDRSRNFLAAWPEGNNRL